MLPPSTEQQAYEALVNARLIRPTNVPPSNVDNVIIIEDDDMKDTSDGINKVQEYKIEESNSNPVIQRHVPDTSETQTDQISAGPNGVLFFNDQGQ